MHLRTFSTLQKSITFLFGGWPMLLIGAEKITYDDHVFPIFEQSCLNCHNPDKTKGGLDLSTFSGAMKGGSGGKIAEPGDVSSKILTCVTRTAEPFMPPEGDALTGDKISVIKAWIESGLLENKNSAAKKPSKPKFETAMSADPGAKPEGPPPMPTHVLLEPVVAPPRGASIHAIAASPWAPLIAITSLRQVVLVDSNSLEIVGIFPFPEGEPISLNFTPDARYLIVAGGIAGKSGTSVTFDVVTGERVLVVGKEFDTILACDIRPGFDIVASGSPSKMVKLWNSQTGEQAKSIKKHTDWVTSLDISPDGILLATGDRNGGVYVWEAATGGEFHTLRAHQSAITHAQFRNDSNILGTSSEDGTIRFWEMNGGTEVKKIDAHPGGVTGFAWARDGSFVSIGRDLKAKLWKADFNLARDFTALPALPTAVAIDAEGKRAFIGDVNGTVQVVDCATGAVISTLGNNPPTLATRIAQVEESIKTHPETLATTQQQVATAQAQFDEQKKTVEAANQQLQNAKNALAQAQQKEVEMKGKLAGFGQNLTAKKAEAEPLRAQQAPAQAQLVQVKAQLASAQAAGQGPPIEQAQAAVTAAENTLADINNRLTALDAAIATMAKEEQDTNAALAATSAAVVAEQGKIAPAEAALKAAQDAVPAKEKALADSKSTLEQQQGKLLPLKQQRNRWIAATINTQALAARAEALQLQRTFEEEVATFSTAASELEKIIEQIIALEKAEAELQSKCAELEALTPPDEKLHAQQVAALKENQLAQQQQRELCQKAELALVELRSQIDEKTAKRLATQQSKDQLKADYLRQLEQKIE